MIYGRDGPNLSSTAYGDSHIPAFILMKRYESATIYNPIKEDAMSFSDLVLPQTFDTTATETVLTKVPVDKPSKTQFFRVNPNPEYTMGPMGLFEQKEDRETYLVTPDLINSIPGLISTVQLVTYITRQGNLGIWPLKLPGPDGRDNDWWRTAREAADLAREHWIRIVSNQSLNCYDITKAIGVLSEPQWPAYSLEEILEVAFRGFIIDSEDHSVIQQLRGLS